MRRKPLAAVLVLLSAALVLGGNALLDAGWGSALRSIADRVLPNPNRHVGARARARQPRELLRRRHRGGGELRLPCGRGGRRGHVRELQLIFFGRESDGEGWLRSGARRLGRALPRVRCGRGARGCARGSDR